MKTIGSLCSLECSHCIINCFLGEMNAGKESPSFPRIIVVRICTQGKSVVVGTTVIGCPDVVLTSGCLLGLLRRHLRSDDKGQQPNTCSLLLGLRYCACSQRKLGLTQTHHVHNLRRLTDVCFAVAPLGEGGGAADPFMVTLGRISGLPQGSHWL